jgi:hypothetical protein
VGNRRNSHWLGCKQLCQSGEVTLGGCGQWWAVAGRLWTVVGSGREAVVSKGNVWVGCQEGGWAMGGTREVDERAVERLKLSQREAEAGSYH